MVPLIALIISTCSLLISLDVWRRSARPTVAAAVRTHSGGNMAIFYDLVLLNSGGMPAKNVRLIADQTSLAAALGPDATEENRKRWLACFGVVIPVLLNNDKTTCSFGTTQVGDTGFWKYSAVIEIEILYEGRWRIHREKQQLRILDTDSFTGYQWE